MSVASESNSLLISSDNTESRPKGVFMPTQFRLQWLLLSFTCLFTPMVAHAHEISSPETAAQMARAAGTFLSALSPDQLKTVEFTFEDKERLDWHYVPRNRSGLALKDMSDEQRILALEFLKTGLSPKGYWKSTTIIKLEAVLREIETWNWMGRDPEKYFFSFFGQPSDTGTWGWRVEGHHLSLNITVVRGHLVATAPRFLGANPALVTKGELNGMRTLAGEEDLARKILKSMNQKQLQKTVFRDRAYSDIVTGSDEVVPPLDLAGISARDLSAAQKESLIGLIDEYLSMMPSEIGRQRMAAIRNNGLDQVHFGWAGSIEPGQPHYYRIQGATFLVEYDNVQNSANHIHTVWRDFDGDFGRDLLREHYRAEHQ